MPYNRQETIRRGTGAAKRLRERLRADLRRDVWPRCARCLGECLPSRMQIDHIVALVNGGEDVDDNVQALCLECHRRKTNEDLGHGGPPF